MSKTSAPDDSHVGSIAIIGMALRVPDAPDLITFWQNLLAGRESIRDLSPAELDDDFDAATRASPSYVRRRPVLDGIENFDAAFFGMSPREAALTDPQQRVFLECSVAALEDAAIDPACATGPIGVFAGSALNTYFLRHVVPHQQALRAFTSQFQVGQYQELLGAMQDFVASRVAYKLNLKGPAVTVQSACSTSLLAVAQACQSLQLYQCDAALAGGVSISVPQKRGYESLEGGMVSSDGHVRPFDKDANGTVFGSGCGVVVLKRLEDAVAAGDHIYAVIRGTGVNNDGADKIGFTAPSAAGQADVIRLAHANAGVTPGDIGYVEAHGTATPLGDPIEFRALADAFAGAAPRSCILGSLKANVGHLDAAAGVTGLIKTALALHHDTLPPQINFAAVSPAISLAESPFRIETVATPWPRGAAPRRAGVSAFGVGGTNVHIVVEEAPARASQLVAIGTETPLVLALSAKSPAALTRNASRLARALEGTNAPSLADTAETLATGRSAHPYRLAISVRHRAEAVAALDAAARKAAVARPATSAKTVFLFPGQGAQYPGMALKLYSTDAVLRDWIDRGAIAAEPLLGLDIRKPLFDPAPRDETTPHALRDTTLAQPALYIVEHALAQTLIARGVKPDAMLGHSLGEFVAAALAGVFSFEDGLRLVATRGQTMQSLPGGAMLAVRGTPAAVERLLAPGVEIAAINAPQLITVAGTYDAIATFEARAAATNLVTRRLHTSHAFHSAMMDPAVAILAELGRSISLSPPNIPFVSAVTGTWITDAEATSVDYWARHARMPVLFATALETAVAKQPSILLEVGPGRTLATFARQSATRVAPQHIITTQPEFADRADDAVTFTQAVGDLWVQGFDVALPNVPGARRVPLPGYAFEPTRHWIEIDAAVNVTPSARATLPAPPLQSTATMNDRKSALTRDIVQILEELSGETITSDSINRTFLELGFDSLMLGQVAQRIQKSTGAKVGFRQLLADLPTISQLVDHLVPLVPKRPLPVVASAAAVTTPMRLTAIPAAAPSGSLDAVVREQLAAVERIIAQQLQALGQTLPATTVIAAAPVVAGAPLTAPAANDDAIGAERFRMFEQKPRAMTVASTLSEAQNSLIKSLITRSDAKFRTSKSDTQTHRRTQADPRSASGFRAEWKDLVYPLVVTRSQGSKLHDADGNTFVDLVNGFGQTMFGHAPDFVTDAIRAQLDLGFAIGPQTPLAGELATELANHLGHQRVAFCNTGSEAVMAAMRIARAVTGRSKIVFFGGDYHGQFDEVLAKGLSRRATVPGAQPAAAGIPRESVSNIVVLPYDAPESLNYIRANADDLAAVLVEPVQSRNPALFPQQFLRDLRALTLETGTALIFDEVVTGFRVHPQGVQGLLGITADIATYGKVLGGGMPLGVLAGTAKFLDALDGGDWQFGDASVPEVAPTFFAGTFVRHPLTLAAAKATLAHMRDAGPTMQTALSAKTAGLVDRLNASFSRRGVQTRAERFSSFFYFNLAAEDSLASLLYPLMRLEGVHIAESFPCFLTTAHTDADIAHILAAFETALDALHAAGILVPAVHAVASIAPAIRVQHLPDSITLTPAQREIYLAAQLDDRASCAFNEQVTLTFDGSIYPDHLTAAVNDLVARHDALRGYFGGTGEHMTIAPQIALDIPLVDLSVGADPRTLLLNALAMSAALPFDLANGPLVRATLFKLAAKSHTLVFAAHHIVCDGWSLNVIVEELAALYSARTTGTEAQLPEVLPFRVFAATEATAETSTNRAFWTAMYRNVPEPLELPSDRPRPVERTWAGATVTITIGAEITRAFKQSAAKHGATLFSALFASLQLVLGRLAGSTDVVITVPMAAQTKLEGQSLVGHAVNFLPLRARFDAQQPFARHLATVNTAVREALVHQDYTLGSLVADLSLKRTIARTPLSDVQFNLERLPDALDIPDARLTVAPAPKAAVNFDLFFNVIESRDGLRIDVDYNIDMYEADTVRRWIGHLQTAMQNVVSLPDVPLAEVELLAASERASLLVDFTGTARHYPRDATVHALFEAQARKTPTVRAVTCNGTSLSYAELDAAANRLAHLIVQSAPGPRGRVAVAVDRSTDMLVALLAVMKSGHAYVPLDPTHPGVRLAQTLDAADVSALLVSGRERPSWVPDALTVVALDASRDNLRRMPATPVSTGSSGSSGGSGTTPAYVIFTSGSTGTPKGVEIGHRAVVNFLLTMAEKPGFNDRDHLLAVTTVCFDIAGLELYLPLISGGSLTIATRDTVQDVFALVRLAAASGTTVMQATPSLWRLLLEAGFKPTSRIKMLCGGEPLPRDLADELTANGAPLWNLYGPTETTIWSAVTHVGPGPVSIGRAIANTQLVVLDDNDQLSLPGTVGELNIGGDGLADCYFKRPDLTAAAFRDITLAPGQTHRLYRTGDLARRHGDGRIALLGRRDQQVKLRGYRIELEDVEATLRAAPNVSAAAVSVLNDAVLGQRLVAFVVPAADATIDTKALAAHATAQLPAYMVPTAWVTAGALPMTANGKLDRKTLATWPVPAPGVVALPAKAAEKPLLMTVSTAVTAGTETEVKIASVWRDVLGLTEVSLTTPVLDAGADSLHLFRIASRLHALGIPLQARDLLKQSTIERQARLADERLGKAEALDGRTPALPPTSHGTPSLADYRAGLKRNRTGAS